MHKKIKARVLLLRSEANQLIAYIYTNNNMFIFDIIVKIMLLNNQLSILYQVKIS